MDIGDLRLFETVARLGGITRAAAALNTVQSNVTTRIRLLEHELGVALFNRHRQGVSLTSAGETLLPYAIRIGNLVSEAKQSVSGGAEATGKLVLGTLETVAALRLPPILAGFSTAHPGIAISLEPGTTASLIDAVLGFRLEGAFVCGPVQHPDLVTRPAFSEELVLVTPASWGSIDALAGIRDLRLVVLRAGCSYRARLEAVLAVHGIIVTRLMEFGTLEGIIGCVEAGLGVTLLPRAVVAAAWGQRRLALHSLPPAEARVETLFIRHREGFVSRALGDFLASLEPLAADAA